MRRAGRLARRGAALFNGKCSRYCLWVPAECSPAGIECHIVLIFALDGTNFGALAATGTFRRIDKTGLLKDLYSEISRLAANLLNFRKGQQFDVKVPADLDQLGRNDSHRAFVCGEGLVQLGHASADCRTFFEKVDEIS